MTGMKDENTILFQKILIVGLILILGFTCVQLISVRMEIKRLQNCKVIDGVQLFEGVNVRD